MTIDPSEWRSDATDDLLDTILALPDRAAAERFFRDLCTLRELHDLAQRWHVVRLLDAGQPVRRDLAETGASTATITRIAQWLHHGTGGYREALARTPAAGREDRDEARRRATRSVSMSLAADDARDIRRHRRARPAAPGRPQQGAPAAAHRRSSCTTPACAFEDGTRALTARVEGFPLDILFVRTDDIVEFVADGVADLGHHRHEPARRERRRTWPRSAELGYGHCRLEAAVPNGSRGQTFDGPCRAPARHEPSPRHGRAPSRGSASRSRS